MDFLSFLVELLSTVGFEFVPGVTSVEDLDEVVKYISNQFDQVWSEFAKPSWHCVQSKAWWTDDCARMKRAAMERSFTPVSLVGFIKTLLRM